MSLHDVSHTLFCYDFASVIHTLVSLAPNFFSYFNYDISGKRLDKYVGRILFSNHIKIQMNVCPCKKMSLRDATLFKAIRDNQLNQNRNPRIYSGCQGQKQGCTKS